MDTQVSRVAAEQAEAVGTSPANLVSELLEKQFYTNPPLNEDEQKAQTRFENHFGEIDLGYPLGADNESIDEDLVKDYADTHEAS